MINSYYVVLKGKLNAPAIFTDYRDLEKVIEGYKDAEYEYFDNIEDACSYIMGNKEVTKADLNTKNTGIGSLPINMISYNVNESDFKTVNSQYGNTICIYVSGGYNFPESKGYYSVLIKKYDRFKHIKKDDIENSTPNRVMLYGIIDALDYISDNNEMEITVFAATSLGFKSAIKHKGNNADLICEFYDKVKKKNLKVTCVEMLGKAQEIKDYISFVKTSQKG